MASFYCSCTIEARGNLKFKKKFWAGDNLDFSVFDFLIWEFLFLLVLGVSYSPYSEKRDLKKIAKCDRLNHYHSKSETVKVAVPSC